MPQCQHAVASKPQTQACIVTLKCWLSAHCFSAFQAQWQSSVCRHSRNMRTVRMKTRFACCTFHACVQRFADVGRGSYLGQQLNHLDLPMQRYTVVMSSCQDMQYTLELRVCVPSCSNSVGPHLERGSLLSGCCCVPSLSACPPWEGGEPVKPCAGACRPGSRLGTLVAAVGNW